MKLSFTVLKVLPAFLLASGARAGGRSKKDTTVLSAVAGSPEGLEGAVEAFKVILGGENNGSGKAAADGHRIVNWDAPSTSAPNLPFDMPGDFFANTVTRGLIIQSDTDDFRVSNPDEGDPAGPDDKFDSINRKAAKDFITFSEPRLFTPLGTNEIELTFEPAQGVGKAAVSGFGAVFVDVDKDHTTYVTAYDKRGRKIFEQDVEPYDEGLSFLGVAFPGKSIIYKVVLTLGNKAIDGRGDRSGTRGRHTDIVVLDDFLYGEPQAI